MQEVDKKRQKIRIYYLKRHKKFTKLEERDAR
jgi:hypothetical protein